MGIVGLFAIKHSGDVTYWGIIPKLLTGIKSLLIIRLYYRYC
jgi:hypothetical protein